MQINEKLILYLEELSNLTLSENEKKSMLEELQKTVNNITLISELKIDNVPMEQITECSFPFNNFNIFRNDEVISSFDRELILKNAPVKNDEFFIAPKTVD